MLKNAVLSLLLAPAIIAMETDIVSRASSLISFSSNRPKIDLEKSIAGLREEYEKRMREIDDQEFNLDFKTAEQKRDELFKHEEAKLEKHIKQLQDAFVLTIKKIKRSRRKSEIPHSKSKSTLPSIKE